MRDIAFITPRTKVPESFRAEIKQLLKDNYILFSEDLYSIYINMTCVCYKIAFSQDMQNYRILLGDVEIGNSYLYLQNKLEAIENIIKEIYIDMDYGTLPAMAEV